MNKAEALAWLKKNGTEKTVDGMARYGIVAKHAFGVTMGQLIKLKKQLGKDQALSLQLWDTGWYEARLLAALIGDPAEVTKKQMNAWAAGFENWADCDTACFALFDRTPFAWEKTRQWAASPKEFVKRGAFALMASITLHDKTTADEEFLTLLPLIEKGAEDDRNFVKKAVSWALRSIGRRSQPLNTAAIEVAKRLARSEHPAARWVGKDALRELTNPKIQARLARPKPKPKTRARTKR